MPQNPFPVQVRPQLFDYALEHVVDARAGLGADLPERGIDFLGIGLGLLVADCLGVVINQVHFVTHQD